MNDGKYYRWKHMKRGGIIGGTAGALAGLGTGMVTHHIINSQISDGSFIEHNGYVYTKDQLLKGAKLLGSVGGGLHGSVGAVTGMGVGRLSGFIKDKLVKKYRPRRLNKLRTKLNKLKSEGK